MEEQEKDFEQKERQDLPGCIATILTVLYAAILIMRLGKIGGIETFDSFVLTLVFLPYVLCVCVAAVFSAIGFLGKKRWAILTAAILMLVAGILMIQNMKMVILQSILFFISYMSSEK